jgi:hypothetical protein
MAVLKVDQNRSFSFMSPHAVKVDLDLSVIVAV